MGQDGEETYVLDHYFDQVSEIVNAEMISGYLIRNKRGYIMIEEMLDFDVWPVVDISISYWWVHNNTKNSLSIGPFKLRYYTQVGCNGHPLSSTPLSFKV